MVMPLKDLNIDPVASTLDDLSQTMGMMDRFEDTLIHDHAELQELVARIHTHLSFADLLSKNAKNAQHVSNVSLTFCLHIVCARAGRLLPKITSEHKATRHIAA